MAPDQAHTRRMTTTQITTVAPNLTDLTGEFAADYNGGERGAVVVLRSTEVVVGGELAG